MTEPPDFRAVIRRDELRLVDWHPWLVRGRPLGQVLRERGSRGVRLELADLLALVAE